jgi:hypothetical protein
MTAGSPLAEKRLALSEHSNATQRFGLLWLIWESGLPSFWLSGFDVANQASRIHGGEGT